MSAAHEPAPGLLLQMIQQNDEKNEEAHKRLRSTCREHEGWIQRLERQIAAQETALATLRATPPEVTKLRFSPSVVLGIVTISISIAAGIWASTYGLRSDVRDLLTQQAAAVKLSDERAASMKEEIANLKRDSQLWKYDVQTQLKEIADRLQKAGK